MLNNKIIKEIEKYYKNNHKLKPFVPRVSKIGYSGRVYNQEELINLVASSLEFWLTEGRWTKQFQEKFCKYLNAKHCIVTNSGSSANLLAISALTSPKLGDRRLKKGDEVITVAAAFPTTVTPIIQNGLVPVFVDIELDTLNIDVTQLEDALSDKTKAVILAHTLGNPFNIKEVKWFCEKHNLWLIEDNCDALGSKYDGKFTGTFGDIGTHSFFPAHHITMGEGGALVTDNDLLAQIIESFRHWGSDCYCKPGTDNTCGKRFNQQIGTLPHGYDHKYTYTHIGYNLKITDMQAAVGCAQLDKLDEFIKKRQENYKKLFYGLSDLEDQIILPKPQPRSEPSWFAFPITQKMGNRRRYIIKHIENNKIQTRLLFCGNITRHPMMDGVDYRVVNELKKTDWAMKETYLIGLYPGMTNEMLLYMIKVVRDAQEKCWPY